MEIQMLPRTIPINWILSGVAVNAAFKPIDIDALDIPVGSFEEIIVSAFKEVAKATQRSDQLLFCQERFFYQQATQKALADFSKHGQYTVEEDENARRQCEADITLLWGRMKNETPTDLKTILNEVSPVYRQLSDGEIQFVGRRIDERLSMHEMAIDLYHMIGTVADILGKAGYDVSDFQTCY